MKPRRGSFSSRWRSMEISSLMSWLTRLSPFRMCRFPFKDPTSGRCSSTVPTATRAADICRSERAGHLFGREGLDDVAGLHAPDALHADPALEALQHLTYIVLEPLERAD